MSVSKLLLPRFSIQRLRRLLSALLLSVPALTSPAQSWADTATATSIQSADDTDWLARLARTDRLNYRGVLTYTRGDHQESLRVTHGTYRGELYERLEHLDGDHREVIRYGEQLTCIQLGQRLDRLLHRHLLKAGLADLEPYYAISVGEEIRIAGRSAVTLNIKPRDEFRFGYRLALDRDTGLPLRSEALDHRGQVLERLQFVDIEIGDALKQEWVGATMPAAAQGASNPMPIERIIEEEQMPWKPRWLPPGFALALAPHRRGEDALTYSDGLAVLSVFIETAKEPLPRDDGSATQGATVAYTRPLQVGATPQLIVIVGEVPAETARRVANSVTWSGAPVQAAEAR